MTGGVGRGRRPPTAPPTTVGPSEGEVREAADELVAALVAHLTEAGLGPEHAADVIAAAAGEALRRYGAGPEALVREVTRRMSGGGSS